jgi:hypothetical protein
MSNALKLFLIVSLYISATACAVPASEDEMYEKASAITKIT